MIRESLFVVFCLKWTKGGQKKKKLTVIKYQIHHPLQVIA